MIRFMPLAFVLLGALACASSAAWAQTDPSKPIRLILPFPPGGPTDIVRRLTGQKLAEQVRQQVIADSRPGASGNIGLELAVKSPPDGYTIVLSSPVISLSPHMYTKLNYDPQKDLALIGLASYIRSESARFGKVIKEAGIKGE